MAQQATEDRAERSQEETSRDGSERRGQTDRAEMSNLDIVQHHFWQAAERLDLPDDVATVLSTSYREHAIGVVLSVLIEPDQMGRDDAFSMIHSAQ